MKKQRPILVVGISILISALLAIACSKEEGVNPLLGQWASKGVFITNDFTIEDLTPREKQIYTYVNIHFSKGAKIEFYANNTFEVFNLGKGKYEFTKDNRLKLMNHLAGVIVDYEVIEDIAYIKTNKIYIHLYKE